MKVEISLSVIFILLLIFNVVIVNLLNWWWRAFYKSIDNDSSEAFLMLMGWMIFFGVNIIIITHYLE